MKQLWPVGAFVAFGFIVIFFVLRATVFAPAPEVLGAWINHPLTVSRGGRFSAQLAVVRRGRDACFVRSQQVVTFTDGTKVALSGARIVQPDGSIVFSTRMPDETPTGQASFTIRDLFNCGSFAKFASSGSFQLLVTK